MDNLLFLKDIALTDFEHILEEKFKVTKDSFEIINYSDFYSNRIEQLKYVRKNKSKLFILAIYKRNYLKWSFIFLIFAFLSKSEKKYIIDSDGNIETIMFFSLLKHSIFAFFSTIIQLLYVLKACLTLLYWKLKTKNNYTTTKNINNLNVAYLRTTHTFNLVAGGSLGHTIGIVEGFLKLTNRVHFFGIDDIKGFKKEINKTIISPLFFLNYVNIFNEFIFSSYFVKKIRNKFKKNNFDLIYQRLSKDNISGVILSRKYKIPLIVEYNSSMYWENNNSKNIINKFLLWFTNQLESITLIHADLIVAVSDVLRDELISAGYSENKILVAYNGVNTDNFSPVSSDKLRTELNIPTNKITFGFSGTFGSWHGIDILEEAIEIINKTDSPPYFLLIGDGFYRKRIEDRFKGKKNVIFTGKIPYANVVEYLSICDVYLSPHANKNKERFIGSPTKLFEYLSMGKITIASDLEQISEIISPSLTITKKLNILTFKGNLNNSVGIKVTQGNSIDLSNSIKMAVENFDKLKCIGKNARIKAIKYYTWDAITKKILYNLN